MLLEWSSFQIILLAVAGLMVMGFVAAHLFLHTKPTPVDSFAALALRLKKGQPTLLYLYSNF